MTPDDDLLDYLRIKRLGEAFADAANRREHDLFADLWAQDGVWEIGVPIFARFEGRSQIREGIEKMLGLWDFFVQMPHACSVDISGDTATSYWTLHEVARSADAARGNTNISFYLDDLRRGPGGWKYERRRYRTIYQDNAPLLGAGFAISAEDLHRLSRHHNAIPPAADVPSVWNGVNSIGDQPA